MIQSKFNTWISGLKGRITAVLTRIGRFFTKTPVAVAGPGSPDGKQANLDDDEFHKEYYDKLSGLDDIIVQLGIYERFSASHKYMYEMGRQDGSLGVKLRNLADIARANAQEIFRHIYIVLKGKLAATKAEFDAINSITNYDEVLYKREQSYYNYAKYQYRFFPRSHSFFLFLLYMAIAFALIIADIPLALRLIQHGFSLEGDGNLPLLFTDNYRQILAANWESLFTAIGIALCTVYIKIYYDEFVGTPYANRLKVIRRLA